MADLLQPKDFTVKDQQGVERTFTLSKFPAIQGREIIAKYPVASLPKLGDYAVSEEIMVKLMSFVAVAGVDGAAPIRLSTRALIDNHVPDWETLAKIEMAMMEYNCSFFQDGRILNSLEGFVQKVLVSISKMLTDSSAQSSQKNSQPSNS